MYSVNLDVFGGKKLEFLYKKIFAWELLLQK